MTQSHLQIMGKTLKKAMKLEVSDSPSFQADKTVNNCVIQLCKVASTGQIGDIHTDILMVLYIHRSLPRTDWHCLLLECFKLC